MITIIKLLIMNTAIFKQYNLYNVSPLGGFVFLIKSNSGYMTKFSWCIRFVVVITFTSAFIHLFIVLIHILSALLCRTGLFSVQDPIWGQRWGPVDIKPRFPFYLTKYTGHMSNSSEPQWIFTKSLFAFAVFLRTFTNWVLHCPAA